VTAESCFYMSDFFTLPNTNIKTLNAYLLRFAAKAQKCASACCCCLFYCAILSVRCFTCDLSRCVM